MEDTIAMVWSKYGGRYITMALWRMLSLWFGLTMEDAIAMEVGLTMEDAIAMEVGLTMEVVLSMEFGLTVEAKWFGPDIGFCT